MTMSTNDITKENQINVNAERRSHDLDQSPILKYNKTNAGNRRSRKQHQCDICGKTCARPSHVIRHMKAVHPLIYTRKQQQLVKVTPGKIKTQKHFCDICKKGLSSHANVVNHKKSVHGVEVSGDEQKDAMAVTKYKCHVCEKYYTKASSLRQHKVGVHKMANEFLRNANLRCSECFSCYPSKSAFDKHLSERHPDIMMEIKNLSFKTNEEFKNWILEMEKETVSKYKRRQCYESPSAGKVIEYACNRSGHYKGTGVGKRSLKIGGSIKTGFFCPSKIHARAYETSHEGFRIDVVFHATHIGHKCEQVRLRLSKREKKEIRKHLQAGVPMDHALHNISESACATNSLHQPGPANIVNGVLELDRNCYKEDYSSKTNSIADVCKERAATPYKEEAITAVLGLIPEIQNLNEEQYKKIIAMMSTLKNECDANDTTTNKLPPAISTHAPTKNIQQLRYFRPRRKGKD